MEACSKLGRTKSGHSVTFAPTGLLSARSAKHSLWLLYTDRASPRVRASSMPDEGKTWTEESSQWVTI